MRFRHRLRSHSNHDNKLINAPMVEVFGGTLALLIILYALINLIISENIQAMLERSTENAEFKVSWTNGGEGLVIIAYPDKLRILETNESIITKDICQNNGKFLRYVDKIYNNDKQQIIFAILEGAVKTMAKARNCIYNSNPNKRISIGWIIANSDLLNTIKLEDLPVRIKKSLTRSR